MVRNGKICLLAAVMALLLLLTACGHEHTWTEETTEDYIQAVAVKTRTCEDCGEVEEEIIPMETLHDDSYFLCSTDEFIQRISAILQEEGEGLGAITVEHYEFAWMFDFGNCVPGYMTLSADGVEGPEFSRITMTMVDGTQEMRRPLFTSLLRACIPALDDPDALLERLVEEPGEKVTENGLICRYTQYDAGEWINIAVSEWITDSVPSTGSD